MKNACDNPEIDGHLLLTVAEAARLLRISRNLGYELIHQGHLPSIRLGRRILVPRLGLQQWINRQAGLPESPPPMVDFASPQQH